MQRLPWSTFALIPLASVPALVLALAVARGWLTPSNSTYIWVGILTLIASLCLALVLGWFYRAAMRRLDEAVQEGQLCSRCQRLQEAEELKNRLMSATAHELNTPLHGVIGFTELLLEGTEPLSERQRTNLVKIRRNARHLLDLVEGVLELTRIQSGRAELNLRPVHIGTVVDDCLQVASTLLKGRQVELISRISPDLPMVHSDERRLNQILMNLLSNAVKFTESGSITVTAESDGKWVTLTVSDTGPGMTREQLAALFDHFQRGGIGPSAGGTGLGLAISRETARLLGGSLSAESTPGVGSAFTLRIPVSTPPTTRLAGRRIIVAEPDAASAQVLKAWLNEAGLQAQFVSTGQAVNELALAEPPGAIILETSLPDRDGWTLLRRLKAQPETRDVPVLITTRFRQASLAYELGAAGCLAKPLQQNLLMAELRAMAIARQHSALVASPDSQLRTNLAESLRNLGLRTFTGDRLDVIEHIPADLPLALLVLDCGRRFPERRPANWPTADHRVQVLLVTDRDYAPSELFGLSVVGTLEQSSTGPETVLSLAKAALLAHAEESPQTVAPS